MFFKDPDAVLNNMRLGVSCLSGLETFDVAVLIAPCCIQFSDDLSRCWMAFCLLPSVMTYWVGGDIDKLPF